MTDLKDAPFVVMTSSAHVRGKARKYGQYRNVAVVQTDGEAIPAMISDRARHMVRIVRHFGSRSVGKTPRCQYHQTLAWAETVAAHLNRMHRVSAEPITVDEIDAAIDEEFRRELIEAYGGMARYFADADASIVQRDVAGTLLRREVPNGEPIVAVAVTCPSTGREYVLRVPPTTSSAREGVAWTFGLAAEAYYPTIQS